MCCHTYTQFCADADGALRHFLGNVQSLLCVATVSYFAFSATFRCSSISSIWIYMGTVVTLKANGVAKQLKMTFLCFKVTKVQCEFGAKWAQFIIKMRFGTDLALTSVETGRWHSGICVSGKHSFTWNAFTESPRPSSWSWRFKRRRWVVMSARNANLNFKLYNLRNCGVFLFTVKELADFLTQLKKLWELFPDFATAPVYDIHVAKVWSIPSKLVVT